MVKQKLQNQSHCTENEFEAIFELVRIIYKFKLIFIAQGIVAAPKAFRSVAQEWSDSGTAKSPTRSEPVCKANWVSAGMRPEREKAGSSGQVA